MQVEIDKLKWEVKRQKLDEQLNEKIDECEELKKRVARLNNMILSMEIGNASRNR